MTDERIGERLWEAIDRLPIGDGGVVLRHYETETSIRTELASRVADICRRRSLALAIAGDVELSRTLGADLTHNPREPTEDLLFSRAVHSLGEAEAAKSEGASLVFVSPIFATRSHPERKPLHRSLALRIARVAGVPAIALGGMDARKWMRLKDDGFYGWAGIDAWLKSSA